MLREGYILVQNNHTLFPDSIAKRITQHVIQIAGQLEAKHQIKLPPSVQFELKVQGTGSRSSNIVVRTIFSNGPYPNLRLIFSNGSISQSTVRDLFPQSKSNHKPELLVLIEESIDPCFCRLYSTEDPSTCRLIVNPNCAVRAIEDVLIDVMVGSFFRDTSETVRALIQAEGLPGLFRRKARYCRSRISDSWLDQINKSARYGLLSSLGSASALDDSARAEQAYASWLDFITSLGPAPTRTNQDSTAKNPQESTSKIISDQLPSKRIMNAFSSLPDGDYLLIVLRRSLARKSPEIKGWISSLFGPGKRLNSFKIVALGSFSPANKTIRRLFERNIITVISVRKRDDTVYGEHFNWSSSE